VCGAASRPRHATNRSGRIAAGTALVSAYNRGTSRLGFTAEALSERIRQAPIEAPTTVHAQPR
jgi:hypothetical protein